MLSKIELEGSLNMNYTESNNSHLGGMITKHIFCERKKKCLSVEFPNIKQISSVSALHHIALRNPDYL